MEKRINLLFRCFAYRYRMTMIKITKIAENTKPTENNTFVGANAKNNPDSKNTRHH